MAHHPTKVQGFISMEELAITMANLRYDALAEFLGCLSDTLSEEADKDEDEDRINLSSELRDTADLIDTASVSMEQAWEICEPHIDE